MGLKEFLQDEGSVKVGLWVGKHIPLPEGHRLALRIGAYIARKRGSIMVRNVKVNQWVISGGTANREMLDHICKKVIQNLVTAQYEYFYYLQHKEEGLKRMILMPEVEIMLDEILEQKKPTILLGPHMGNFDLFGMMLAWLGLRPLVLSYPNPNNAYKAQNALREDSGLKVRPLTFTAFRTGKKYLKEGKTVVTGIDRPVETGDLKYGVNFFGHRANLPAFYIRLAQETGAVARIAYGMPQKDGKFRFDCSAPIDFENYQDPTENSIRNLEKVVTYLEKIIRAEPAMWAMFHPVWPDVYKLIDPDLLR
ncbi:MAG: lysophospholipid acyltransferase family protein [Anaerolineaceae bacterium]|jgi:lauroyl/myristoyl acyltransferase